MFIFLLPRCFENLSFNSISWSERHKDHKAELLARQYLEEEQRQKEEKLRREIEDKEEMRRMLLEQMEKKAAEEASNNLRVQNRNILWLSRIVLTYFRHWASSNKSVQF